MQKFFQLTSLFDLAFLDFVKHAFEIYHVLIKFSWLFNSCVEKWITVFVLNCCKESCCSIHRLSHYFLPQIDLFHWPDSIRTHVQFMHPKIFDKFAFSFHKTKKTKCTLLLRTPVHLCCLIPSKSELKISRSTTDGQTWSSLLDRSQILL